LNGKNDLKEILEMATRLANKVALVIGSGPVIDGSKLAIEA
jgi:hypothetical protein